MSASSAEPSPPASPRKEPARIVVYALYVLLAAVRIAVLVIVGIYGT